MPNSDLISRDAMIKKIKQIRAKAKTLTGVDMVMLLEDAPAVDAAPVVHGRWVKIDVHVWKCSICGEEDCFAYIWREVKRQDDLFCPHCGAKMDGGD